ncbi:hypothetical protein MHTCC0001_32160 [Flavobacteriaceae bacterium MHTCC 0001]
MKLDNPELIYIVTSKYPFECDILQKKGCSAARVFTDDDDNFIILQEDNDEDETLTVTFLKDYASGQKVYENRNKGTFFIVENLIDLKKLIDMNLVYYYNYHD